MVVKLVRWPSWPPFSSRKYEAIINIRRLEGLTSLVSDDASGCLVVEIKWKGQKIMGLSSWRRSVKRNYTKKGNVYEEEEGGGLCVDWNEEFTSLCSFLGSNKEDLIPPWKVSLKLLQKGENQVLRNSYTVIGTASLNLAEYASKADGKEIQISLPLKVRGSTAEFGPLLSFSLNLLELRTDTKPMRVVQRSIMPVTLSPTSPLALSTEKDGLAVIRAGLDRVKIFRHCVSAGRPKEVFHEEDIATVNGFYIKDKDSTQSSSLDSDSLDDDGGTEDSCVRQPFGYEKLANANRVAGLLLPGTKTDNDNDECWIYCGNGAGCLEIDSDSSQTIQQNSMRKILSWRKRKLSFKSPKIKGEPLLKKHYGEDGGDDIDFDRRQLSTNELFSWWYNLELSAAAFGDDNFAVGTWEQKEVTCRDGCLKIKTEVFFASIDQRSERASGESACTALVAVIADWLLSNQDEMPIKSELDNLIRDGSAEWRNLCENKDYMEQFADKHFDLDTVINAKIRPLSVVAEKSYVGFFHPEGLEEEGVFEFLKGAMSFNTIWDEISQLAADLPTNESEPIVYIVSWNDHFFILKVDKDAYYIIDTLGERLYEGCNQAYILKFDKETVIHRLPNGTKALEEKSSNTKESKSTGPSSDEKTSIDTKQSSSEPSKEKSSSIKKNQSKIIEISQVEPSTDMPQLNKPEILEEKPSMVVMQPSDSEEASTSEPPSSLKEASTEKKDESGNGSNIKEEVVCTGKECCQEYIKSFLAAIPIRELLEDVKKNGLSSSTPLHQRLQIEFHRAKVILQAEDQILASNY
ncbi:uncharacterized protein LOC120082006 [Benincasa hispida]|uniref:uncharacterized protein LOC120082006 n=1 Tax=Benincasa hispida TaxID=102211 RepID=UPI001901F646|nr:uncharacterized protein LOC120082006 [Benincasa hispida]